MEVHSLEGRGHGGVDESVFEWWVVVRGNVLICGLGGVLRI